MHIQQNKYAFHIEKTFPNETLVTLCKKVSKYQKVINSNLVGNV